MKTLRTLVTFQCSSFNTSQERDDFINPGNFGDDVARYLMDGLRRCGLEVEDEVGQEDHGWFFTFRCAGAPYDVVVGWGDGEWILWIGKSVGLLSSLLGGRKRGISPNAVEAVHTVISTAPNIHDIQWHVASQFQAGKIDAGTTEPLV